MGKLSAIIFDCDGVLVDTEYLKYQAWQQALGAQNIDFTISEYMPLIGGSSKKIMAAIAIQKSLSIDQTALINEKNSIYDKLQIKGVRPINDAINFLKKLIAIKNEYSIKIGLASSAPRHQILENLKQIDINSAWLDEIVSGSDDLKHIVDPDGTNKPKPYIYRLIADKLSVNPDECLVFEDSAAGVISAADAGMVVIATPNQFTENHDFTKALVKSEFKELTIGKLIDIMAPRQSNSSTQNTFKVLAPTVPQGNINLANNTAIVKGDDFKSMPKKPDPI